MQEDRLILGVRDRARPGRAGGTEIESLDDLGLERAVGVMGGHQLVRGSEGYAEAARLGRALAATGRTVLSGGGPGAMEAVDLGAALVGPPDHLAALELLSGGPRFADDVAPG